MEYQCSKYVAGIILRLLQFLRPLVWELCSSRLFTVYLLDPLLPETAHLVILGRQLPDYPFFEYQKPILCASGSYAAVGTAVSNHVAVLQGPV